jgi:hypothetical protein
MGVVKTNNFSLAYAIEDSLGVLTSTTWKLLEPNDIGAWGGQLTTTPRDPISNRRQRRKGVSTDLESNVEFEHDLTIEGFVDFAEAFAFANFQNGSDMAPTTTGCDTDSYTISPVMSAALIEDMLIYVRGASNSDNNGLKEVASGATTSDIPVEETLVTESFSGNVTLEVAGFRCAQGDVELAISGTVGTLSSTIADFTDMNLSVGQTIHIGGTTTARQFTNSYGYARITAIAANALTLDKLDSNLIAVGSNSDDVDLLFGRFLKNVSVNDSDYIERSFHFEGDFPNLGSARYEYSKGNVPNTMGINLPETDKATISFAFVGQDTDPPTDSRLTGADDPLLPVRTGSFSTATSISRLRVTEVDETGITTDFKECNVIINNNASGEKVLAYLGNKYINTGNFEIDLEGTILFTSDGVINAIRNNTTVTMDFIVFNDDGAISIDIPSMTLGDGQREFARNESIKAALVGMAFEDTTLGTSIGISIFPIVPTS